MLPILVTFLGHQLQHELPQTQGLLVYLTKFLYGGRDIGQLIYRLTDTTFSMHLYERTKVITHFG